MQNVCIYFWVTLYILCEESFCRATPETKKEGASQFAVCKRLLSKYIPGLYFGACINDKTQATLNFQMNASLTPSVRGTLGARTKILRPLLTAQLTPKMMKLPFILSVTTFGWVFSSFWNIVIFNPFMGHFPISTDLHSIVYGSKNLKFFWGGSWHHFGTALRRAKPKSNFFFGPG